MRIKKAQQLNVLEKAIERCKHSVWMESAQGKRYDMKDEVSRKLGLEQLILDAKADLELYANARREDEAIPMEECRQLVA